jgi:hypothetical protein
VPADNTLLGDADGAVDGAVDGAADGSVSAHLTALSTAQMMKHQTVQLMGQLTARCSVTQTAYQPAQWMVLQMAQCSAHLTALSTAQMMAHQKVQLMGQLLELQKAQ